MKATMFVISEAAAKPGIYYAGWDRLRAAARSERWDIEAHTHDAHHQQTITGGEKLPALTSLAPGESLDGYRRRVAHDLEENSAAILAHIGRRPLALAYPFGAYGADRTNDPGVRDVLREEVARRFVLAFHQDGQDSIPLVDPTQERISLRRLEVENVSGMALFRLIDRASGPGEGWAPGAVPLADSPSVTKSLPAIPFVGELRQDPGPVLPEPPRRTVPSPAPKPAPATETGPPLPSVPTTVATTTTSTAPWAPVATTTTTSPPTTSTTARPPTTTTTTRKPPTTSTTQRCVRPNGKPCSKR